MIDRATVDKIMDAVNIVDVVGEFVNLRKAGVNYKGLCPFHDDKTPSFMVSPARQICKCFACGEGGNAVNFLMKHEQITYPEALRWLAKKYNIEIQERELTDEEKREQNDRESMFVVNEWACHYFHEILMNDADGKAIGRAYFRSRGIRDDIIEKFQLGFALTKRDALVNEARRKGYKDEFLLKTGLCYERNVENANSQLVDRFAGRAIFPWFNVSGKVVAFGGRKLDAATKGIQQKYVNSPDSEIYHKERELYGIYQAKKAIVKEDCVYMVEGYTDVIAMHQCGLENVVANSGTALSIHQVKLLHRFTQNIVLLYDGDEAGIHAAMRGTDMLLQDGMNIKVLILPDGDDPDSFARKHTADDFRRYIEEHQTDFIQFKTDLLLRGVTDPVKRSEAIGNILKSVSIIPDPLRRTTYLSECAHRFGVREEALVTTVNKYIEKDREDRQKERERAQDAGNSVVEAPAVEPIVPIGLHTALEQTTEVERLLVQNIIRHGGEIIFENLEAEDGSLVNLNVAQYIDFDLGGDNLTFSNALYNQILKEAVEHSADPGFVSDRYFLQHPNPQISQLAAQLGIERHQLSKSFEVQENMMTLRQRIQHLILDFRLDIVNQHLKEIQRELRTVGTDRERMKQLMDDFKEMQFLRNELAKQRGTDVVI
jgi:DNA primase